MPTYEYECKKCGLNFDKFQGISAKPLESCPECGGQVKRKLGTGSGFIMKGSSGGSSMTECGREAPCCGRDVPCEEGPCHLH